MKEGDLVKLASTAYRPVSIGVVVGFKKELVKVHWAIGIRNQPDAFWEEYLLEVVNENG